MKGAQCRRNVHLYNVTTHHVLEDGPVLYSPVFQRPATILIVIMHLLAQITALTQFVTLSSQRGLGKFRVEKYTQQVAHVERPSTPSVGEAHAHQRQARTPSISVKEVLLRPYAAWFDAMYSANII